jgi:hypothetical protein
MVNLFFLPSRVAKLPRLANGVNEMESKFYKEFRSTGKSNIIKIDENVDMIGVKPTRSNIDVSLKKCDVKGVYPEDDLQKYVEDITYEMLREALDQTIMTPDDVLEYTTKTSPAKDWIEKGCRTKGEAVAHKDFSEKLFSISHPPLVDVNGKKELLELTEILNDNKIRTTFNPAVDFIFKEKIMFGNQDEALLSLFRKLWIKYGFVKQYGGFDTFAKSYEKFTLIEESDVKGWDRVVNLIGAIRLRLRGLRCPPQYESMLFYVVYYILYPHIVFPDGVIRIKDTGNISGSACTTTNNSIAHTIIAVRYVCNIWKKAFGVLPTLNEILEHHLFGIYSDDNLAAHDFVFFSLSKEQFWEIKVETYKEFGMTLKDKQCLSTLKDANARIPKEHSFLGSYFYFDDKYSTYVPYPRINKICSSLRFHGEKYNTIEEEINKAISLSVLAAGEPWLSEECRMYSRYLISNYDYDTKLISDEFVQVVKVNMPNYLWLLYTLGKESSYGGGRF